MLPQTWPDPCYFVRYRAGQDLLGGREKEKFMKKALTASVSHTEETIWHQPESALPITVTQRQPDFENPAGGAEVGRNAAVGGAGESGAGLKLGR